MCTVVGIVAKAPVNQELFDALTALQHRGQNSAGITTFENDRFYTHKSNGLVRDVFQPTDMLQLKGNMGIGHVRYPTAGCTSEDEAQPFYVNSPYGITLAHNGNLTNAWQLKHELFETDLRHLNTDSDSEILLNVFAHELQQLKKVDLAADDIFEAVAKVHSRCKGAYAVVSMISDFGVVGFRDPFGIRPLVYGKRTTQEGDEFMIASESVGLDALGFSLIDSVAPGEAIVITKDGEIFKKQCASNPQLSPCLFELVYLARPDSIMDKILVYKVRLRLGDKLADKILKTFPDHDIDVVMPIPDTSRTAASTLAKRLEIKYREGYVKNRYIGRTFIMTGQKQRRHSVRQKLNTVPLEFKNKNVLLVDDSIVRGTTAKEIIQMARDAGAKKVYFASAAPEVKYPNVYGIDTPTSNELIAHDRSVDEIAELIGADWLLFQDMQVLVDAAREGNPDIKRFEDSVFTGDYVTGNVSKEYLDKLEEFRSG